MLSMTHREAAIFDDACTVPTPCLLLPADTEQFIILSLNSFLLNLSILGVKPETIFLTIKNVIILANNVMKISEKK